MGPKKWEAGAGCGWDPNWEGAWKYADSSNLSGNGMRGRGAEGTQSEGGGAFIGVECMSGLVCRMGPAKSSERGGWGGLSCRWLS